jgi:uncharacterized membrane protein
MSSLTSSKIIGRAWSLLALGSAVGLLASFIQTVERINYAKNPQVALSCDLNSIFSCTNVFDAWQSSVFGFSNSLMCIVFFALTLGAALAGLTGSNLQKHLRLTLQFFSLFFLGFGAWYLWQSAYVIGALCIFCIGCYGSVIVMNWAWLRINANDLPLSSKGKKVLQNCFKSGADTFGWVLYGIIVAGILAFRFL